MLSNILRNIMSPVVVQLSIVFSAAVVAEASLSFLGWGRSRRSLAGVRSQRRTQLSE